MHYIIPGDPIPLSRARIGFGARRVYDAQKEQKTWTAIHLQSQQKEDIVLEGPLRLDIIFYMRIPKQARAKTRHQKEHTYHFYKPDLSNLIKFCEDVSNKLLFRDDAQIAQITACKIYHEEPRTEFKITKLDMHEKYI